MTAKNKVQARLPRAPEFTTWLAAFRTTEVAPQIQPCRKRNSIGSGGVLAALLVDRVYPQTAARKHIVTVSASRASSLDAAQLSVRTTSEARPASVAQPLPSEESEVVT